MGVPIRSIKSFEEDIRFRSQKDWTLVFIVNAHSDSSAAQFIHRNFLIMDTISNDVDFYMPGYNVSTHNIFDKKFHDNHMNESWYKQMEKEEFADAHIRNIHPEIINSPRLGMIMFSEVEFADFVMELTRKINGYSYLGACQMILIPITRKRTPNYGSAQIYDLDRINIQLIDNFIHRSFNIIRENTSRYSLLETIFNRNGNNVIGQINKIYKTSVDDISDYRRANEEIEREVIRDMERCLQWSLRDEYFFISYSSCNTMMATMLKDILQRKRLKVWMAPDGIPQGREYSLCISKALRNAKHFILLLTPEAASSRWVKRELDIAICNEGNTKIKILLAGGYTVDDIRSDDELKFYINRVQAKYEYDDVIRDESFLERFLIE